MHAAIVLLILILTYIGMAAGRIAWLQVDRTGIALLAVIALLASGEMTLDDFGSAVDLPTLAFLFAMMIISAQFAELGFIDLCARTITETRHGTATLLALTVVIGGGLSAVLANDILIIAISPLLIAGAQSRGLDPRPLVTALAAATNGGSAATLIGNPQNILIGALGRLDFWIFLAVCAVPAMFTLDRRLPGGLAAMAQAHQPDGARGDARCAADNRSPARPQPDHQRRGRLAGSARAVRDAAAARDRRADHRRPVARQPQDHQPHYDRRGGLAAIASRCLPLWDHRRPQPFGSCSPNPRLPDRTWAVAE